MARRTKGTNLMNEESLPAEKAPVLQAIELLIYAKDKHFHNRPKIGDILGHSVHQQVSELYEKTQKDLQAWVDGAPVLMPEPENLKGCLRIESRLTPEDAYKAANHLMKGIGNKK